MNANLHNLACAVIMQAVKDYLATTSTNSRNAILKDLRSPWMDMFSNGLSVVVAEQLEQNPKEIKERLRYSRGAN